ncbi:MAG: hypothetical protein JXA28_15045, partial [Bacteroidetes bacterium]|nr:hypothetical protein [Bacteroidota bacterium]
QIPFAVANLFLRGTDSILVTSRNAEIRQSAVCTYPNFAVTAFHQKLRRMDTRTGSQEAQAAGWEITDGSMRSDLETAMQEVLQLQTADPVTQNAYDIVMHPTFLWDLLFDTLLPHLDTRRVLGMDGGSPVDRWLRPDQISSTRIGSELLNIRADSSLPRGLATCGWDDTGRPASSAPLVEGGRILRLPTDETLPPLPDVQGLGFSRSPQWNIPATMAMPNIVLKESTGGSLFDMISGLDNGLFVKGRGNVMMNPAKTMFRVRPQIAWMIRSGKLAEPVRGVEIETSVEQFWNSLAALSGAEESMVAGDLFPGRSHALWEVPFSVSVPAGLFRRIPVYTAQEGR